MYKKVLVAMALDHDISPQTLQIAQRLCEADGEIHALHVHEPPQGAASAYIDKAVIRGAFDAAKAKLHEKLKDIDGITAHIQQGHTSRTIMDFAAKEGIDCIVIGSHRPGLSDYFLGSTASRVVRHAHCAVHVQRSEG